MQASRLFLSCFLLASAVPACAAPHASVSASVPPFSFLNHHAGSVHALAQEVSLDPAVRRRLANHFNVTEGQMARYVSRNLVLTRLKRAGSYRVACVRPNGHEYWINAHLPAGTPVFASRATGQPILKLACGNPMVATLPQDLAAADDKALAAPPQLASVAAPGATPAEVAPQLAPGDSPLVMTAASVADGTLDVPAVVQVAGYTDSLTSLASASHANSLLPALLGLLGAGGVAAASHHGGGSSAPSAAPFLPSAPILPSPGPPGLTTVPAQPPVPAPVPESSTLVSLGALLLLGGGFVAARRRGVAGL